jgi:iron complex transport system ATP-binding protein
MVAGAAIEARTLDVGYGRSPVVSAATFSLMKGTLTGLAGINGCGKSTLLRTLAGLQPALSGSALISGKELKRYSVASLAREVGVVLTQRIGGFNLTVFDAVAAGMMPHTDALHRLKPEHIKRIEDAMALCGVSDLRARPVIELSDGQFQKTMIARLVAQDPAICLLDEPTAFLDYGSRHELFRLLVSLARERNKCVLVSSHDLDLLLRYCDNLIVVDKGRLVADTAANMRDHPALKSVGGNYL